ncbi:MAG: hypothetical protein V3V07_06610 [candidate division NC10 bacterium]
MDRKATILRFPPKLYERLIREAGERAMTTGKRVSVNEVIMEILEGYLEKKTRKRKGVK